MRAIESESAWFTLQPSVYTANVARRSQVLAGGVEVLEGLEARIFWSHSGEL
jgi:hypothetical protein